MHIFESPRTQEHIERLGRFDGGESGHTGIDDAQPAIIGQRLKFLCAFEDIEIATDDDVATTEEHFFQLRTLLASGRLAQRKVHEKEGHPMTDFDVIQQLFASVAKKNGPNTPETAAGSRMTG